MRGNLDKVLADLQHLQGNSADREGQRRAILTSLAQNDCGPQYRAYASRGATGFFESLFGGGFGSTGAPGMPPDAGVSGDTYRTICVRTCDGYYFPVSYSTMPDQLPGGRADLPAHVPGVGDRALQLPQCMARTSRRRCRRAASRYSELPNAFAYRKAFNASCSCKAPGQTWADALRGVDDQTVERGDIVVTEEQAKQLSQPVDAKGRPMAPKAAPKGPAAEAPARLLRRRRQTASPGSARCAPSARPSCRRTDRTA